MEELITARGHENVRAAHASTLEVTSDDYLTPAGDCIVGVEADRVPADFDDAFLTACRDPDTTIVARLEANGRRDRVVGTGHPEFTFGNERSLVLRTSDYVDDRTVMVDADGAAADLDRDLVDALASGSDLQVTLSVE